MHSRKGFTLLSALVAMVIASILAWAISSIVVLGARGGKSAELKQDLNTIRTTIRDQLDCEQSLGITSTTSLPVSCAAFTSLKRKDGSELLTDGKLGQWSLRAVCNQKEIIVERSYKDGNTFLADPLTKFTYSWADLFNQTSDFCYSYLAPNNTVTRLEYGGEISRCPFSKDAFNQVTRPATLEERRPAGWPNPLSNDDNCPAGYTPTLSFSYHNSNCNGPQLGWYSGCGWNKTTGDYFVNSETWDDSYLQNVGGGRVEEVTFGLGCGLETYQCIKKVTEVQ